MRAGVRGGGRENWGERAGGREAAANILGSRTFVRSVDFVTDLIGPYRSSTMDPETALPKGESRPRHVGILEIYIIRDGCPAWPSAHCLLNTAYDI